MQCPKLFLTMRNILHDSLYRNSLFLIGSNITTALFGFLFWMAAARFYPAAEVGIASTLISLMMFLAMLSLLGYNISIIKYLPHSQRGEDTLNSSFSLIILAALAVSSLFIWGIDLWSPSLHVVKENIGYAAVFMGGTLVWAVTILFTSIFIAKRASHYVFIKESLFGLFKIPIPIILVSMGSLGIFCGWAFGSVIGVVAGILFLAGLVPGYRPRFFLDKGILRETFSFSSWNYVASIFSYMPGMLLPAIITNVLAPEVSAYFYMAWLIASVLYAIPLQVSQSLFAEGSNSHTSVRVNLKKSVSFAFILIGPAILFLLLFGDRLLLLLGSQYSASGFQLLQWLALSAVPYTVNLIYFSMQRILGHARIIALLYGILGVFTLLTSIALLPVMGLVGVGIAWLTANIVVMGIAMVASGATVFGFFRSPACEGALP